MISSPHYRSLLTVRSSKQESIDNVSKNVTKKALSKLFCPSFQARISPGSGVIKDRTYFIHSFNPNHHQLPYFLSTSAFCQLCRHVPLQIAVQVPEEVDLPAVVVRPVEAYALPLRVSCILQVNIGCLVEFEYFFLFFLPS